jgi:UDP-2,3-diacylglucosamine pyrophosphatase LpxH
MYCESATTSSVTLSPVLKSQTLMDYDHLQTQPFSLLNPVICSKILILHGDNYCYADSQLARKVLVYFTFILQSFILIC